MNARPGDHRRLKVAARTPVALPGTALFSLSQLSVAGIGNGRVHVCNATRKTLRYDYELTQLGTKYVTTNQVPQSSHVSKSNRITKVGSRKTHASTHGFSLYDLTPSRLGLRRAPAAGCPGARGERGDGGVERSGALGRAVTSIRSFSSYCIDLRLYDYTRPDLL